MVIYPIKCCIWPWKLVYCAHTESDNNVTDDQLRDNILRNTDIRIEIIFLYIQLIGYTIPNSFIKICNIKKDSG